MRRPCREKVAVLLYEVGGAPQIGDSDVLQHELVGKRSKEGCLSRRTQVTGEEVADFGDHRRRDEERTARAREKLHAPAVIVVVGIGHGDQWASVDKDHGAGNSERSMVSAAVLRSGRPLRPTAVKLRRRGEAGTSPRPASSSPRRTPATSTMR